MPGFVFGPLDGYVGCFNTHAGLVVDRGLQTYTASRPGVSKIHMRIAIVLLAILGTPGIAQAMDCPAATSQPIRSTITAPVASEFVAASSPLGAPNGVLSQAFDEAQSVDQVLLRIRIESCANIAMAAPAPSVLNPNDPATYKPRTQFDNTPWRFNMSQNGKNMTADEFSAWMKSRGVRVARGAGIQAPAAVTSTYTSPAPLAPGLPAASPALPPASPPSMAPVGGAVQSPASDVFPPKPH